MQVDISRLSREQVESQLIPKPESGDSPTGSRNLPTVKELITAAAAGMRAIFLELQS
jgi:hypothetical protein